jgi:hypothetical protein
MRDRANRRLSKHQAHPATLGFAGFLQRDAVNLAGLLDAVWLAIFEIAKERLDCRQASIAALTAFWSLAL